MLHSRPNSRPLTILFLLALGWDDTSGSFYLDMSVDSEFLEIRAIHCV
jgi:hypothetical protein